MTNKSLRAYWIGNKLLIRTWALFVGLFVVLLLLFLRLGSLVQHRATDWTATVTAWALRLLGDEAEAKGSVVTSSLMPVRIIFECTAVLPVMVYLAAVIAYPCPWRRKLSGVALGVPSLLLINEIRLISLFYIGHWYPTALETVHLVVWQSLMIFITLLLWLLWAAWPARRTGPRHA